MDIRAIIDNRVRECVGAVLADLGGLSVADLIGAGSAPAGASAAPQPPPARRVEAERPAAPARKPAAPKRPAVPAADLDARVVEYLKVKTDGAKVGEIGAALNVESKQIAPILRKLRDGKTVKMKGQKRAATYHLA